MVFDVEDGVQNVLEPQHSVFIKREVRNNITNFLNSYSENDSPVKYGIRVNALSSSAFDEDIALLKNMSPKVKWKTIFLPKINCHEEILTYLNAFNENNIAFEEVIPIIETAEGYKNTSSIVKHPVESGFKRVAWGNHDFNLDCGYWPFQDIYSPLHWPRMKAFISCLKKMNYEFINPPILELDNKELSMAVLNEISMLCKLGFSQVALSHKQALLFLDWQADYAYTITPFLRSNQDGRQEKISLAKSIVEQFKVFQVNGKSFSIIDKNKKIISPQEFLAAQNFLHENS